MPLSLRWQEYISNLQEYLTEECISLYGARGVKASKLSKLIGARGVKGLGVTTPLPPKGHDYLSVGFNNDARRFIVHTKLHCDAGFLELLYKSAEEYGFDNEGILMIAYEAKDFEEWMITRAKEKVTWVESA
ncbi:PREDICTED: uncharacterized protein LOC105142628 [Populus euphratica]|uniref:Uncharacterized protein LOC105142628 n=1 Tax=Populus euphratica TaxID=75702 RepID=A0AAJ6VJ71_POPEU|nr:PREDICTED: uncharacterized protein LOC105142628 [Populus euphratica]